MTTNEVQKIIDWVSLEEHDKEILEDYVDYQGCLHDVFDTLSEAKDKYLGNDLQEFARECVENDILNNIHDQKIRDVVETYFNYDEYERELMFDIIIGEKHGNIFSY